MPLPLADVLDGFDELADGNDHFEFYWFPHTDVALTKRNNRVAAGAAPPRSAGARLGRRRAAVQQGLRADQPAARSGGPGWSRGSTSSPRGRCRHASTPTRRTRCSVPSGTCGSASPSTPYRASTWSRCSQRVAGLDRPVGRADPVPDRGTGRRGGRHLAVHRVRPRHRVRRDPPVPPARPRQYFDAFEQIATAFGGRPHWGKLHTLGADRTARALPAVRRLPRRPRPARPRPGVREPYTRAGLRLPEPRGSVGSCMTAPEPLEPLTEDWTKALAVVAHPDDLEFGGAAAIARWTGRAKRSSTACSPPARPGSTASRRPSAARCGRPSSSSRPGSSASTQVEFLGQPDGTIEYGVPLRRLITREVRRHQPGDRASPTTSATPGTAAPLLNKADHINTGKATLDAVRDAANRWIFPEEGERWSRRTAGLGRPARRSASTRST